MSCFLLAGSARTRWSCWCCSHAFCYYKDNLFQSIAQKLCGLSCIHPKRCPHWAVCALGSAALVLLASIHPIFCHSLEYSCDSLPYCNNFVMYNAVSVSFPLFLLSAFSFLCFSSSTISFCIAPLFYYGFYTTLLFLLGCFWGVVVIILHFLWVFTISAFVFGGKKLRPSKHWGLLRLEWLL